MSTAVNAALGAVASSGSPNLLTLRLIDEMRAVADVPIEDTMRARLLLIAAAERLEYLVAMIEELEGEE